MEGGGWETEVFGTKGNLQGTIVPGKTSEHQYNPANIYAWGKKKNTTQQNQQLYYATALGKFRPFVK